MFVISHETAWALVDSQNQIVVKGEYNEFQSDTTYNSKVCVPNDCYKLTLYDSYGDG